MINKTSLEKWQDLVVEVTNEKEESYSWKLPPRIRNEPVKTPKPVISSDLSSVHKYTNDFVLPFLKNTCEITRTIYNKNDKLYEYLRKSRSKKVWENALLHKNTFIQLIALEKFNEPKRWQNAIQFSSEYIRKNAYEALNTSFYWKKALKELSANIRLKALIYFNRETYWMKEIKNLIKQEESIDQIFDHFAEENIIKNFSMKNKAYLCELAIEWAIRIQEEEECDDDW